MCRQAAWASRPLQYFQIYKKVGQKVAMLQERVGNSIFSVTFFVRIVGQLVKTPPPPKEGVSAHHCASVCVTILTSSRPHCCFSFTLKISNVFSVLHSFFTRTRKIEVQAGCS